MIREGTNTPGAEALVSWPSTKQVHIALRGRLTAQSVPEVWPEARRPLAERPPPQITVDGSGMEYCDGAGLGLLLELQRAAAQAGSVITFTGLSPGLHRLLAASTLTDPRAPQLQPPPREGAATRTGKAVTRFFQGMALSIAFIGEMVAALASAIVHPSRIRGRDFWLTCRKVGADALPVVCLLGGLIGLIMAFQTATAMARYGATSFIPTIVAIALVRELGPLIVAVIVAGRSGSAFAAELGTMKVTEELDALRTFGLPPVSFLAIPRVLAAILMMPLLTIFANLLGIAAGLVVMAQYGYSTSLYVSAVTNAITYVDLVGGLFKTLVFGLIIGAVGCMRGLRTGSGPSAVGDSTTGSVVAGIVLVIAADMVFGVVYYYLGI